MGSKISWVNVYLCNSSSKSMPSSPAKTKYINIAMFTSESSMRDYFFDGLI